MFRYLLPFALVAILIAACGGDDRPEPTEDATSTASPMDGGGTPDTTASPDTPTPAELFDTEAGMVLREFVIAPQRTSARPGTVTFNLSNEGELDHEFIVIRTDVGHANLPRLENNQGVDESDLEIVGRTDRIPPGSEAQLELDLEPDTYVLICNLTTDSTSHYLQGMFNRFTVSHTAPPPATPVE